MDGASAAERGDAGLAAAGEGQAILVAVDPAGGGSEGDYSAAQVLEVGTGLQCAEFAGHVAGLELAQLISAIWRGNITARGWWWSGTITGRGCWR